MKWVRVTEALPPERKVVLAKEENEEGTRNMDYLCVMNGRWCYPPGGYHTYLPVAEYTPTHWLNKEPEDCCCEIFPRTKV